MAEHIICGNELPPGISKPKQLFILLHGAGAVPSDMLPVAIRFQSAYPDAVFQILEGTSPLDAGENGRQWFSINGITEENRVGRVAEAMQALNTLVHLAQDHYGVLSSDTVLVGFSQGAIMALEFSVAHDGGVGRIMGFSGRYAQLPEKAPEFTTVHLLHGKNDNVIPVEHAYAAYERLANLQGDVTLDIASSIGHEMHKALVERGIYRLQTCVPLRSWRRALGN